MNNDWQRNISPVLTSKGRSVVSAISISSSGILIYEEASPFLQTVPPFLPTDFLTMSAQAADFLQIDVNIPLRILTCLRIFSNENSYIYNEFYKLYYDLNNKTFHSEILSKLLVYIRSQSAWCEIINSSFNVDSSNDDDWLLISQRISTFSTIWEYNAFQLSSTESSTIPNDGLYSLSSQVNHSCHPNAVFSISPSNALSIVSLRPIAIGEEIVISYLGNLIWCSKRIRQHYLFESKGFHCRCDVCLNDIDVRRKIPCPYCNGRCADREYRTTTPFRDSSILSLCDDIGLGHGLNLHYLIPKEEIDGVVWICEDCQRNCHETDLAIQLTEFFLSTEMQLEDAVGDCLDTFNINDCGDNIRHRALLYRAGRMLGPQHWTTISMKYISCISILSQYDKYIKKLPLLITAIYEFDMICRWWHRCDISISHVARRPCEKLLWHFTEDVADDTRGERRGDGYPNRCDIEAARNRLLCIFKEYHCFWIDM